VPGTACPVCKGRGLLSDDRADAPQCALCRGSGKYPISTTVCSQCGGYGRLPLQEEDGLTAVHVEPGTHRSSHLKLKQFFEELSGELRICDPYYGTGTLHRLDGLTHCSSVLFLTRYPDDDEKSFIQKAIEEFRKQHRQVEFRRCRSHEIHDRYILAPERLILLGNGLKDIGGKESFVVQLPKAMFGDVLKSVRKSFDKHWEGATPL
jgi:hypothetical protein